MSAEEFKRMPLFLKRRHVLAVTGWTVRHLDKLVEAGQLRPVRGAMLKRDRMFKRSDIEAMLAS
jgi:hypothetical protein